jgi:hypothetical protein
MQAEVKDGGSESSVCFAALKDVKEALRVSAATRGNDGDVQRFGTRTGQIAVEACTGTITIHGSE